MIDSLFLLASTCYGPSSGDFAPIQNVNVSRIRVAITVLAVAFFQQKKRGQHCVLRQTVENKNDSWIIPELEF